jgi:sucrose-6-phosphate hydrolase SacC (GH32 family)
MDQHGCGENDPNAPIFDPVHGVFHHFYQVHLAAPPGSGPDYGHFVSKDLVDWASMPVALWNGLDVSVWPPRVTPYDTNAIYSGSAVIVDGAGPGGKCPGIVQIYPGRCLRADWANCTTGTLLAQAVPADYENDELLTNWSKPSYNPIVESTQRDPSAPWKTSNGEWRLRTYDAMVYASASDADLLAGKWHAVGISADLRECECPSLFPLPGPTPGTEGAYKRLAASGSLPTHVHKTSCGGDWWQLGTYDDGAVNTTGSFKPTPGWHDLFEQRKIDAGYFYASKDAVFPSRDGGATRRVNWGWAKVLPDSVQTLPRIITFNPVARTLEQAPAEELISLRGAPTAFPIGMLPANTSRLLTLAPRLLRTSETNIVFGLPAAAARFGLRLLDTAAPSSSPGGDVFRANDDSEPMECAFDYEPPAPGMPFVYKDNSMGLPGTGVEAQRRLTSVDSHTVVVRCGAHEHSFILPAGETSLSLRVFADATMLETFFQGGRVAMTEQLIFNATSQLFLFTDGAAVRVKKAVVYPMRSIWTTADEVRKQPRIF